MSNLEKYSIKSADLGWIRHGDLLMFRASGWFSSRIIAQAGRGKYSHAGMAARWGSGLLCLEVREWKGGRAVTLASQVARYPGQIEVFNVAPEFLSGNLRAGSKVRQYDRQAAVFKMMSMTGCSYGWWHLLGAAIRHLPFLRLFVKPLTNGDLGTHSPFCSEAVAIAARAGGVDAVRQLANRLTEPNDLARSLLWESSGRLLIP